MGLGLLLWSGWLSFRDRWSEMGGSFDNEVFFDILIRSVCESVGMLSLAVTDCLANCGASMIAGTEIGLWVITCGRSGTTHIHLITPLEFILNPPQ